MFGFSSTNYEVCISPYLAMIIQGEAPNEPFEGKIAVAQVVLKRAGWDMDKVKEVIFAKGQFDGVRTRRFYHPTSEDYYAAVQAYLGPKIVDATYFANARTATDHSWLRRLKPIKKIGNHTFYEFRRISSVRVQS